MASTLAAGAIGYYFGKSSGLRKGQDIADLQRRRAKKPPGSLSDSASDTPVLDDEFLHVSTISLGGVSEEKGGGVDGKDGEDEEEEEEDGYGPSSGLTDFSHLTNEDCKMVFVVRTDLGMTKGKIAAQVGHATLMCYKAASKYTPTLVRRWESYGQAKIAVQTLGGEEELMALMAQAVRLGVVARIVRDAGRTQIPGGSATVLGLGPAPRSVVDQISGGLKLL